jgi:hypothetical protein
MDKFAKIEEQIPDGFEARSMESKEGIFTFRDGLVKFVWMNLPPEPGFVVSYRLVPLSSRAPSTVSIKGQLSYIDEGRNIIVDIVQRDVDLAGVNEQNIEQFLSSAGSSKTIATQEETPEDLKKEPTPIADVTVTAPKEAVKTGGESRTIEPTPVSKEQGRRYSDIPPTLSLPVEAGIYYRVQLAATHRIVDPVSNYKKYNLDRPVLLEFHDGWYKYSIGSFPKYSEAKAYRQMIVTKKRISGAFIVAYQNGQRIEVRDAWRIAGRD